MRRIDGDEILRLPPHPNHDNGAKTAQPATEPKHEKLSHHAAKTGPNVKLRGWRSQSLPNVRLCVNTTDGTRPKPRPTIAR